MPGQVLPNKPIFYKCGSETVILLLIENIAVYFKVVQILCAYGGQMECIRDLDYAPASVNVL